MDTSSITTSKFDFSAGGESNIKLKRKFPFASNNSKVTLSCINIQGLAASYKYFPNKLPSLSNLQSYNFPKDGFQSGTFNKNSFEKPNLSQQGPFNGIKLTESHDYKYDPIPKKLNGVNKEDISNMKNIEKKRSRSNSVKGNGNKNIIDVNKASTISEITNQVKELEEQQRKEMQKKKADERKRWEEELLIELQKRNLDNK